ncbi:ATP-dependent helicase HrpB [Ciceribacter sp. L1K23]|uniref:ATP-dependent helicase HrpB n=1 Tax=Ciceribacter sp. L1K23 TaxID=2820276 RepID=UPI001B8277F9|nr:ATP-dependent helicase HrpB [Ciceribacter sp. L1K23]MBR0557600.1 ATP-dependent helicase HrpB [Ciceribacter sp. L1K23]
MTVDLPHLPVSSVLGELSRALSNGNRAILTAPPGAGKTTLVPLHLLEQAWRKDGRILLLEPRRLAARAAARRMADLLGEEVGQTVGYRMRLDNRISSATRIEVVTEGVFTRMILEEPDLPGIAAVIFDEFHERSLDADFGLALALDVQSALRPDLKIVVMSATLDVDRLAQLLETAPLIKSPGRAFPVEIRYRDRPGTASIEETVTTAVSQALREEEGSILAFLPGQAEIRRVAERLQSIVDDDIAITSLYGNLTGKEQDEAIKPAPSGRRKVVLATSIAETSITIDGVRIVIDSGLQRLPVYEPSTGITRLETTRVSKASADQRAGRAGRTEPGIAIRLWHAGQTAALPAFTPPSILSTDLTGFALDLAIWGVRDPQALAFIDFPPAPALAEARNLLRTFGALDPAGTLTERGRQIRRLGLEPRLSAMILSAAAYGQAERAARLAVLVGEPGIGGQNIDLDERLLHFERDSSARATAAKRLARQIATSLVNNASAASMTAGQLLLFAYPDRIAFARGAPGRFLMANGRGGELDQSERLASERMLVVADVTGRAEKPRILAAARIDKDDIEDLLPGAIQKCEESYFDTHSRQVRARRTVKVGAITLEETPLPVPPGELTAKGLAEGVRQLGIGILPFGTAAIQFRQRVEFLRRAIGEPWPDMSDEALISLLEAWFVPFQGSVRSLSDISPGSLHQGLVSIIPFTLQREMDHLAPTHFTAPTGQNHPIRYNGEEPTVSIRVQELYGLKNHPTIGNGRLPLLLELTSPAHRPIQTTRDLPGFWSGSWRDVRAEMRGRYPKHEWPDNPADANPTTRAKPRAR